MQIQSKQYFANLDGLRVVLAFAVIGSHAMLADTINENIPLEFLKRFVIVFNSGHLAVSFFFVLSGFLITYLMIEEKEKTGAFSIKRFYLRRIYRIWPLYYAVLAFGFFIYPLVKSRLGYVDQNPYSLVHQLSFLSNFDSIRVHESGLVGVAPLMIAITWSVSIEEQFYLVWPLAFAIVKPSRFWIICVATIAGSWIFRLSISNSGLYYHTFAVISDMAVGALGACLAYNANAFARFFAALHRYLIIMLYIMGFLLLMYHDQFGGYVLSRSYRVASGLFFCFIILEQCYSEQSFFKFGNAKTITSAGKYTYALYMLHPIGIQTAIILFRSMGMKREENAMSGWLYYIIAVIVSLILAILSYRYLEKFFLEKRRALY